MSTLSRHVDLLFQIRALVQRHAWSAKRHALHFNIFDVLGRSTDEVKGHSAFLGELLNPEGSHGQRTVFLRLFFEECLRTSFEGAPDAPELDGALDDPSGWKVYVEQGFEFDRTTGRVDLRLEYADYWCIIENKIYAADQQSQLRRYRDFALANGKRPVLVYLTLDGRKPSKSSLSSDSSDSTYGDVRDDDVNCISYRDHIARWISRSIEAASLLPSVRETLVQYRRLIRRLASGATNEELTMEITDLLKQTPENVQAALEIERALPDVKTAIQIAFWEDLRKRLRDLLHDDGDFLQGHERNENDRHLFQEQKVATFYSSAKTQRFFGLSYSLIDFGAGRSATLVVEVERELYYGIALALNAKMVDARGDAEFDRIAQALSSVPDKRFQQWNTHKGTLHACFPDHRLNWGTFDEACARLSGEQERADYIKGLVGELEAVAQVVRSHRTTSEIEN